MASTQSWTYGFIYYFVFVGIIVTLFSISGVFADNHDVVTPAEFGNTYGLDANTTRWDEGETTDTNELGSYSISTTFKDLFSFFVFNISIYNHSGLMAYLWLIRLLFVYLPLLMLSLSIYYSLPTVSG